jgi:hypothetical protein
MIHAHANGYDGMPFFDEADWVGFVWSTGGVPRLSNALKSVLYDTIVQDGEILEARSFRGRDAAGDRVPIEPEYEEFSAEVALLPRDTQQMNFPDRYHNGFYWSHYVTSSPNTWRLICDDEGEADRRVYFLWGGTREVWSKLRPAIEAMPPWNAQTRLELCCDNLIGTVRTDIRPEVYAGLGPVRLVGDLGLFTPRFSLPPQ